MPIALTVFFFFLEHAVICVTFCIRKCMPRRPKTCKIKNRNKTTKANKPNKIGIGKNNKPAQHYKKAKKISRRGLTQAKLAENPRVQWQPPQGLGTWIVF